MAPPSLDRIDTWVFDLDETLYPPSVPLFPQIEARMVRWIMAFLSVSEAEADALRARWWHDHGTTLAGLMREHGADPDPFLRDVHDIDFSVLSPDPALRLAIRTLPGRKVIYTNGTAPYAEAVLRARGLDDLWDAIHGVEHAGHAPKPERIAYERVFARDGLDPARSAMFEDTARNLAVPHDLGMATVHVAPLRAAGDHIHHHAPDLAAFLRGIVTSGDGRRGA
ncbi:MAG: pyrimidine 5'-nucleotidase [Jannaschia sp.]